MIQPKISEKEITHSIRSLLKQFGVFHFKHFGGYLAMKGVSDILGVIPKTGQFLAIEVKTATGSLSKEQEWFLKSVNDAGGVAFCARSLDDVIKKLNLSKRMLF